jgi:hypothetical protein
MLSWLKPNRALAGVAILCVLGSFIVACHAQEAPATYPVRGVVLNSFTRRPIARVLVDGQSDAVLTDNDGRFEINLTASMANIAVRRPGYNPTGATFAHPVKVGPNTPELTFYLTPEANITVHVTLSGGDAADGIRFMAYRKRIFGGRGMWMAQGNYTTDSDGNLRMMNLEAPASYILCSTPTEDSMTAAGSGKTTYGYPPVCYPGVTDLSTASPLTVSPGQQLEAEITIARQPFYPVSILVPNRPQGQPAGISISDQTWRGIGFPARFNAQQGLAEVNLPNGRYYAESRSNNGKTSAYGRIDFQVTGGPVVGLSMALHPLSPIAVEIHKDLTSANDRAHTGIVVGSAMAGANPGINISLIPVDSLTANMGGHNLQHPAGSTDDSYFEMADVLPGRYWVQTNAFQGYVSSISSGGADLAREPLAVGPGGAAAPIEISLSDNGGRIDAAINPSSLGNSASSADEGVSSIVFGYAIPQFPSTAQIAMAAAQTTYHLMFGNLAPGTYRVVAFDKPQEIDMDDPQAMARINSQSQTVTVEPGAAATVQVDVIQTAQNGGEGQTQ